MENLTMEQLEERQAAERAELRLQLDKKLIKENKEKINHVGENVVSLAGFLKETLDIFSRDKGDVESHHIELFERNVESIKKNMEKIRTLKNQNKDVRRKMKERKRLENKYPRLYKKTN